MFGGVLAGRVIALADSERAKPIAIDVGVRLTEKPPRPPQFGRVASGGTLNLNVQFHSLVLDGVFTRSGQGLEKEERA